MEKRCSTDLAPMTGDDVVKRAKAMAGKGIYSMARGRASKALPVWPTPFDPVHGTGDCIALALWACGITRFHTEFLPDMARWDRKKHGRPPEGCIFGEEASSAGWINCDSILLPNTLFAPLDLKDVRAGDLVVYGTYYKTITTKDKKTGKEAMTRRKVHGHIGVVASRPMVDGAVLGDTLAFHLNARSNNVKFGLFPAHNTLHYFRPYNRVDDLQPALPGVL